MANNKKKKKRKGNPFHAPRTVGEKTRFKATPLIHVLSALSLLVQAGTTIFAIYGATQWVPLGIIGPFGLNAGYILLALPVVMWVITIVARIGFRALPLDMWRMPIDVRRGMVVCSGWLLKLATLLVELECAVVFLYVDIVLWIGGAPSNVVMLLWLAALAVSVWLPCRRAGKIGRGQATWGREEAPAES